MTNGYKTIGMKQELYDKVAEKQMELTLKRKKTVFLTETLEEIIEKGLPLVSE